jgi:hypothetical protein|tara:strand:- start:854 stop:1063 length:210 start_codon:yes stop_codon:yes gene_type:complete
VSVSIRRICAGPGEKSKTLIHFSKDYYHIWPTNDYEHAEIIKIFKQDKPQEGILNDYNNHFKALFDNDK